MFCPFAEHAYTIVVAELLTSSREILRKVARKMLQFNCLFSGKKIKKYKAKIEKKKKKHRNCAKNSS